MESCGKQFSESKKSVEELKVKASKENMMKAHFKEFTRAEFDKNYVYGLEPVIKGQDFHECVELCQVPKEMSGRASKIGNDLIYLYHERCLMSTKNFDHFEGRFKVDILAEMKCHVMQK